MRAEREVVIWIRWSYGVGEERSRVVYRKYRGSKLQGGKVSFSAKTFFILLPVQPASHRQSHVVG